MQKIMYPFGQIHKSNLITLLAYYHLQDKKKFKTHKNHTILGGKIHTLCVKVKEC
jgi:hypothetical protein